MMKPQIITMSTMDEYHEQAEDVLRPSCERFGYNNLINHLLPSNFTRYKALKQKAQIVNHYATIEQLTTEPRPIIYTDADSVFNDDPAKLIDNDVDLRCLFAHYKLWNRVIPRTGTVVIMPSLNMSTLVMWESLSVLDNSGSRHVDEETFAKAIEKTKPTTSNLNELVKIADNPADEPSAVVVHIRRRAWDPTHKPGRKKL